MKCGLVIQSRMSLDVSIEAKHAAFLTALRHDDVAPLFRSFAILAPDIKHHLVAIRQLKPFLNAGFRGYVSYPLRTARFADLAMHDDRIVIEFNARKVDYRVLVTACFDELVRAFGAYLGRIEPDEFVKTDFEKSRNVNVRYKVYRVYPVSFYSRALCESAFSLTPEDVVAKLAGKVEGVNLLHGGVKIVVTSEVLPFDELEKRTRSITELLQGRPMDVA